MHVHTSGDSGWIVPRVTIAEGNYIAGCLRLPRPTSVPALTLTLKPESRNSHIYHLFSISDMLVIEIVFKMSYISKSCYFAY